MSGEREIRKSSITLSCHDSFAILLKYKGRKEAKNKSLVFNHKMKRRKNGVRSWMFQEKE
jgi:hypothetical protein